MNTSKRKSSKRRNKPKVKIKGYEFKLSDEYVALVLAIQELTNQICFPAML